MLKKILGYSLLAVVAYISFLIVELPAEVAWRYARSYLPMQRMQVQISELNGTLWDGSSRLTFQGQSGRLAWKAQPWRQLFGDPILQLKLISPAGDLSSQVIADWSGRLWIGAQGQFSLAALNPLFARDRISLDGALDVRDLKLHLDPRQSKILNVDGSLHWSGGTVGYPINGVVRQQPMPGLMGVLTQRGDDVVLDIKDNPASLGVAEVVVQGDGIAKVAVRRKLLDLAGAPWSKNSNPQDIVFRIQQKLF